MESNQSDHDSLEYWKSQAKHYEQKAIDIQLELDEYTENSAQLEKELEASLGQVEKQNRDLQHQNQRLKNEVEQLRNKLERSQHESSNLENELKAKSIEIEKQFTYIRELEQKNDDLERAHRVISESVSYIESLLTQAYERNAVLESEVDEIENLRVNLQRATDEARDLKQELKVVELIPHKKEEDETTVNGHIPNGTHSESGIGTTPVTPQRSEINGNAITPSSRVSAINIVGDLLRKVGLERFLCRECGKLKCSCEGPIESHDLPPEPATTSKEDDKIIFRKPYSRQNSENLQSISPQTTHLPLSFRNSEQPFSRSTNGEAGKLRRSFAVRSREGLENILSSLKKSHDPNKASRVLKK